MLQIAIADDDVHLTDTLRRLLYTFFQKKHISAVIQCFSSGEALLQSCIPFDLAFLDIMMPCLDGIETAKKLRRTNKTCALIYISHFPEHLQDTLTVHPFAFLEKQINSQKLVANLEDYLQYYPRKGHCTDESIFTFAANGTTISIPDVEIVYLEYTANRRVKLQLAAETLWISGSISSYQGNQLLMTDGTKIPVSCKKTKQIASQISDYIHRTL